ncbi:hypothetical protein ACIQU6_34175 [Streptomyces sp. NPDC090442]|uniref:hypothetical protein n=1 Tax=Streptomyces sp. NPDC090442 TaxID=3365962 RepID=UPI00382B06F5
MANYISTSSPKLFARFANPGDSIAGYVDDVQEVPDLDYETRVQKKDKKSGEPLCKTRITLATDQSNGEGDDGRRNLDIDSYGKGRAMGDALKAAGVSVNVEEGLERGGFLKFAFARTRPSKSGYPAKVYIAEYTKPAKAMPQQQSTEQAAAPRQVIPQAWGSPQQTNAPAPW